MTGEFWAGRLENRGGMPYTECSQCSVYESICRDLNHL